MLNGGMNGAIAVKGGNTMVLSPGGMIRLNDIDNLRVLATKKGLILRAGNNGRRSLKLLWKGAGTPGKAVVGAGKSVAGTKAAAATGAQAKAMASSAKSLAATADTLAKTAKTMSAPTAVKAGAGAAKVAAGTIWTGTGASLGLGLGLGALGPVFLAGGVAAAVGGAYLYLKNQRQAPEPPPEY